MLHGSIPKKINPRLGNSPYIASKEMPMFARFVPLFCTITLAASACAGKKDEWSDIDYSKVYRAAGERRDIDSGYKSPTVLGCVDDDLYNCR